jgi:ketosteroid isomerase-like protein
MDKTAVEQELLDLERQYWQSIKDKNAEAAGRLTDEPCIISGAQGMALIGKAALEGMLKAATWTLNEFAIEAAQVMPINDDIAVVAYRIREQLTIDGRSLTMTANDTSTWVRRNGRWVCAVHTEAIAGDPFGRDRR